MRVNTRSIFPYPLPKGLQDGTSVEVIEVGSDQCSVRDSKDREWTLASISLDPGELVWIDGRWVVEPDNE